MKKLIIFAAIVWLLLFLTGCTSSQSTQAEHTSEESSTTLDNSAASVPLPSVFPYTESTTEQNHTTSDDVDRVENTDVMAATEQNNTIPKETEPVEYVAHVGDSIFPIRQQVEHVELFYAYSCIIWKDSKGYCIACNDEGTDQVSAVVRFSDDLELLEADGLEPIEPIPQTEEWVGKTLDEFTAQYGQYHFDFGTGFFYPSYISKNGSIYWMNVQYDYEADLHHMITEFRSFSLKDLGR